MSRLREATETHRFDFRRELAELSEQARDCGYSEAIFDVCRYIFAHPEIDRKFLARNVSRMTRTKTP